MMAMTYHGSMKAFLSRFVALAMLLVPAAGQVWAQDRQVDVELVLAVDVSGSMRDHELALQRRGYAEAFRTKAVHDAIAGGLIGGLLGGLMGGAAAGCGLAGSAASAPVASSSK